MATDWGAESLSAYNDFKEEGFSFVVRIPGAPGVFNPVTKVYDGAVADTNYNTYGVKKNYNTKQIDGSIVQQGDFQLYFSDYGMPGLDLDIKVVIGGVESEVVVLQVFDPGNEAIIYMAQVRG